MAFGYVQFGAPAQRAAAAAGAPIASSETTVEATYSFAIGESVTVNPTSNTSSHPARIKRSPMRLSSAAA